VLGERTEIKYQDIANLKYCSSIFKEALRLFTPVVILDRITLDDMEIDGYKIPKTSLIGVIYYIKSKIIIVINNFILF
jgi:sterol 14-demethylase